MFAVITMQEDIIGISSIYLTEDEEKATKNFEELTERIKLEDRADDMENLVRGTIDGVMHTFEFVDAIVSDEV